MERIKFVRGEVVVTEGGVFAVATTPEDAEGLGREVYERYRLPAIPLVVAPGQRGYRQGVLHVEDLEGYLKGLPRVLSEREVRQVVGVLRGERAGPVVLATRLPRNKRNVARDLQPLLALPFFLLPPLYPYGVPALFPALYFVAVQERLLRQGGTAGEWVRAFQGVVVGVLVTVAIGLLLRRPFDEALGGSLAWALLPASYGFLSRTFRLPWGGGARLYALAIADTFHVLPWLAPLALAFGAWEISLLLLFPLVRYLKWQL
ncbi:MAG: hypothetical protein ABDH20_09885 [Thermus sp.]